MKSAEAKPALKSTRPVKPRVARRHVAYRSPRLTINKSLPVFLFVGILFTSVGSVILYIFRNAEEVVIDYTHCTSVSNFSQPCTEVVSHLSTYEKCWCEVPFKIENDMTEPVFLFYGLITFLQVPQSPPTSTQQVDEIDGESCDEPLPNKVLESHNQTIVNDPASSSGDDSYFMFSDTLTVFSVDHSMYVPLVRTGVAWPDMRCGKCSRHSPLNLKRAQANFSRSKLHENFADMDAQKFENDDFMVWMQPIPSSTFSKLYRKVNYVTSFNGSLPKGDYQLLVTYTYPVTSYGGSKSLIVANSTILGAKNMLLGIAYVVTGCICLIISVILCGIRLRKKLIQKKKAYVRE